MNIVAIGAHPDDIEIGTGGAITLHRYQGDNVRFLFITRGGELSDPDRREREAEEAASVLDVEDIHFLDFTDTSIPYDNQLIKEIEDHVSEFDTDRVYIHGEEDTHQDHRKAALASVAATRNIHEVLAFESPSTRPSFAPQYYIPFSEEILKRKIRSIRTHKSQREKKYLEAEAMKGLARFRGRQANTRYAEAFQVIRITENGRSKLAVETEERL
jgi:LmbE family N-acetylglucosaminyl deacetylase